MVFKKSNNKLPAPVRYARYLVYLFRHKWFVFIECCKYGLFWRGIVHDWSKFLPSEFFPYADFFQDKTGVSGGMYMGGEDERFDAAWNKHLERNFHHWQHWVGREGDKAKGMPIPVKYLKEMLADWRGMKKTLGSNHSEKKWYLEHKNQIILHDEARKWLEQELESDEE